MTAPPLLLRDDPAAARLHWRIAVTAWLGWLTVFSTLVVLLQLPALYRGAFALDDGDIKWIKSLALGASGLGGLVFGLVADKMGRRPALRVSLLLCAAGTAVLAAATRVEMLLLASALAGFGIGGQWASGQMLVAETVPESVRTRLATLAQTGAPLGLGLGTLAALELGPQVGWRAVAALATLASVALPIWAAGLPESDVWQQGGRPPGSGRILRELLLGTGTRGAFVSAFAVTLFNIAAYWFAVSWLPEFMARAWGLSLARSGRWTLTFVAGALLGYFAFTWVAERIGRRPAFSLFSGLLCTGLLAITLLQEPLRQVPALVLVFAFVAGLGTGNWACFGLLYAEIFPLRVRSTAAGVCMNGSRGVQFVAPLLVVAVGGQALGTGVALGAVFAALAAGAVWLLPRPVAAG